MGQVARLGVVCDDPRRRMTGKPKLAELEARLAMLARATEEGFVERADELRGLAGRVAAGDASARDALRRAAHKLRGVAGSAGHPPLSELAARVEDATASATDHALSEDASRLADAAEVVGRRARRRAAEPAARPTNEPAARHAPKPAPKLGGKVVALDDDETMRRLLTITLEQVGGCDAEVTEDPARAMERVRQGGVDLLVVDAMMPEVSGLDLYRAVRRDVGPELRIAILSAATAEELGWELPDDPRRVWLRKPFRPAALIDALVAFMQDAKPTIA